MIDLYSDTVTQPTPAMRSAMAAAEVGDEQRREDPTTNRLQDMIAEMLGKEAAVFLPSGTMCNAVAVKAHTQPSEAILCDRMCHIYRSEFGGAALLSGVTTEPIDGELGIFTPQQIETALVRFGAYGAIPRLLCVEQTHNYGGGSIWPLEQIRAVCKTAHDRGMLTHMDGARLFNASVATGISVRDYAQSFDTAWVDLSKGLGCPIGGVLAGTKDFIARAWRFKHLFGGALRQSGIVAAAGMYAIQHHIQRLREDHDNATLLAQGLTAIKGISLSVPKPATNIVFFDISQTCLSIQEFLDKALAQGVRLSAMTGRVRAVTHLDVSRADIEKAIQVIREVAGG